MKVNGTIHALMPVRSGVGQKGEWQSQEFVLAIIDGRIVQYAVFNVWGSERIAKFNLQIGSNVSVDFSMNARESNGRWFNSLEAYNVAPLAQNVTPQPQAPQQPEDNPPFPPEDPFAGDPNGSQPRW